MPRWSDKTGRGGVNMRTGGDLGPNGHDGSGHSSGRAAELAQAEAGERVPLTICFPLAGDMLGGSHHSLLGLLRGLDRTKFRPLVVVERAGGRLAEHFAGFEIVSDPCPPRQSFEVGRAFGALKFFRTFAGIRRRAKFLRSHKAAIVHTNDGRSHATWALAAKLAGARFLWHHRGDPTARGLRFVAPLLADLIVTVSRFSLPRKLSFRAAREAQVVFSPFDIDLQVDRSLQRQQIVEELALSPQTLICGYFGLFNDRKRPLAFIEAISRLRQAIDRPVAGLMFGEAEDIELEAEMRRRSEAPELAGSVKLMGYRSSGALLIGGCDLLLVTAVDEPLGRTLVEAMLVGTPVVAARSGGTPEAILDGIGILVDPDDSNAMAQAAADLIAQPNKTSAMAARAQISARERFGSNRHVEAISAIYTELAGPSC
jgi:glycosyltransferase involved in cell wall biosynthesis